MSTLQGLKTPLYEIHEKNGGRLVEFAGWILPVQYQGVISEHHHVRTKAGIFDVSHMGEITVTGEKAFSLLQHLTCNDISRIEPGRALYTALLNETGGVIDDLIIYQMSETEFFLCVNASNTETAFHWIERHATDDDVSVQNVSAEYGQIALQGPTAQTVLTRLGGIFAKLAALRPFSFVTINWNGVSLIVARTGYTGEDGFEFFVPWENTASLWNLFLADDDVLPIGLGARDTLRLEASFPLHGHELSPVDSALESGLGWIIKFKKGDFLGSAALQKEQSDGVKRKLVGISIDSPGIARQGDHVVDKKCNTIGVVTSGTRAPTLGQSVCIAKVDRAFSDPGTEVGLKVRTRVLDAHVRNLPFYKRVRKN